MTLAQAPVIDIQPEIIMSEPVPINLANEYRNKTLKKPKAPLTDTDMFFYGISGIKKHRSRHLEYLAFADLVLQKHTMLRAKTDDQLKQIAIDLKYAFRSKKRIEKDLELQAFALLREVSNRTLGLMPYPVQIAAAYALYLGNAVEMATGEGKTLSVSLAAIIHGWIGQPCHVITANDYLVERDTLFLKELYAFCGLKTEFVTAKMGENERRISYQADIVYVTSKELSADFLRDQLYTKSAQNYMQYHIHLLKNGSQHNFITRGIHTAIVDEADSILIDEAVTPLIISSPQKNDFFEQSCREIYSLASQLKLRHDYTIDKRHKTVTIIPEALERIKEEIREKNTGLILRVELLKQALAVKEFYQLDKQYVIQNGKIIIVDEFTGRLMPNRSWQSGLHQLIEAKEGLDITPLSETLARLSFQKFFRLFHHLSGISGTMLEVSREIWKIYRLPCLRIPENKQCQRQILPIRFYKNQIQKWNAIVHETKHIHKTGRPVLIGTRNIKASEYLFEKLKKINDSVQILNAKHLAKEAEIIQNAGQKDMITIATNMAGRGTDIKLDESVSRKGGLHIIVCEGHPSSRIDRQFFGRCARQGDPGTAQLFVSFDDEIIFKTIPNLIRKFAIKLLHKKKYRPMFIFCFLFNLSQFLTEKRSAKMRSNVLKIDDWHDEALSF